MSRYSRLISLVLARWPALSAVVLLSALAPLLAALQPWPIKILVDHALGDGAAPSWLADSARRGGVTMTPTVLVFAAAVAGLAIFLLRHLLESLRTWLWERTGQRLVYDLAGELFARLQRLSLSYHARQSVGDSLSRITGDSWCIYSFVDTLLVWPVYHLLTLLSVGLLAWSLDPVLTVMSLMVAPGLAACTFFFGRRLKERARSQRKAESRLTSLVQQTLATIPLTQMFDAESRNTEEYRGVADQAVAISQQGVIVKQTFLLASGLLMTLGAAVVLWAGSHRVIGGAMSVGSLLVFVAYLRAIHGATHGLLQTYATLKSASANFERVSEVLDSTEMIRSPARPKAFPEKQGVKVTFESVRFGYEARRAVLSDINLEIEPGETLALVGPTGAGKSTLAAMLPRLFDPWQGSVRFNGVDVRDLELSAARGAVAMVLQEPLLLPLSVAENIAYADPLAGHERIVAAAMAADADEFIRQLHDGYDTILGQRGASLSGGQRQRIAIARAFLKDAPVLILDEPTSALDARAESAVMEALDRLRRGRTVLLIAHRLSTARRADRVAVIEQGRLTQLGTHAELLAQKGYYRAMYQAQEAAP